MQPDAATPSRTADLVAEELRLAELRFLATLPGTPDRDRIIARIARLTDGLIALADAEHVRAIGSHRGVPGGRRRVADK
jgi:hypothetical protein